MVKGKWKEYNLIFREGKKQRREEGKKEGREKITS
jgi:hypothetical protein